MAKKKRPISKSKTRASPVKKSVKVKTASVKPIETTVSGSKQKRVDGKDLSMLRESFQSLFDAVEEGIYIVDSKGIFIDVNKGACLMYGYARKQFLNNTHNFLSAEGKNDFSILGEKFRKALNGFPQTFEFWGKRKNGEIFQMDVSIQRGKYLGLDVIISTAQDVTKKKQIDDALRESEQRYRTLQQASFGGIGMHDKGFIIDCNQGLCDITGYSRRELIGFNGLNLISPEWRKYVMEKILSGTEKSYDVEGIHKDGSKYYLEVQAKNVPYQGKMVRVTEFRDITERKLAEGRIKEQNTRLTTVTEDLKRKNDQLEEFTQIVSHNLRSPVGNILTLVGFLESAVTEDERNEYLVLLRESGLTAQQTLQELHEVLKIKQDRKIPKQLLRFQDVFHHVESMLSARITEVSAKVQTDFEDVPSLLYPNIYLESIFLNLLSNSLKYLRAGTRPVIKFRSYREAGCTMLEVSDNGAGINMDRYGHQVFKLHKTFHRHPESRGIGLFMIKNQIEALGGEISMASKENKGTVITIIFNKHHFDELASSDNSSNR